VQRKLKSACCRYFDDVRWLHRNSPATFPFSSCLILRDSVPILSLHPVDNHLLVIDGGRKIEFILRREAPPAVKTAYGLPRYRSGVRGQSLPAFFTISFLAFQLPSSRGSLSILGLFTHSVESRFLKCGHLRLGHATLGLARNPFTPQAVTRVGASLVTGLFKTSPLLSQSFLGFGGSANPSGRRC